MKTVKKVVAVIMTVLTVLSVCSVAFPVFATELSSLNESVDLLPEEVEEAYILSEDVSKREENVKHFLMSDGSYLSAQYDEPVHYKNDNGEWVDYDNSLNEIAATSAQLELFGQRTLFKTNNESTNYIFAEKGNSNTIVLIEDEEYPISWNYQSAKNSRIEITEPESNMTGDAAILELDNISREVLYKDIFPQVDLQFIVGTTGAKENIILKNSTAQNSFIVSYDIGELSAKVINEKTINLTDGEEAHYVISAPYMYDSNNRVSENLSMNVLKNKNGKLKIEIVADSNWLSDAEREYPVIIDPSISTTTSRDAIDSVMISQNNPNTNYSQQSEMIVGRESTSYGYCQMLTKFTLPSLNKGDVVINAELNVYNHALEKYSTSTPDMQVNVHYLEEEWELSDVTWGNKPGYNGEIIDYDIFEPLTAGMVCRNFDITKAVKKWYENPDENFGLLLKGANTSGTLAENCVKASMYTERYNLQTSRYPHIVITYRNNKGIEDYWTYTTLSASRAGTTYINDFSGNLVHAVNIISSGNELMPLSVDCVFNGYVSDTLNVVGKNNSNETLFGRGWRLSIQQTVIPSSYYGLTDEVQEAFPYVYTDGDGTEHYFYETNDLKFEDEDGLGLTLTVNKNSSGTVTGYTITDKKANKMHFNAQYNLIKSEDAYGNYIEIEYDSTGKKILSVTDGAGKTYTFSYKTHIDYITDPSGKIINFEYDSATKCLKYIALPDGSRADFEYYDDYSMKSVKSNDKYSLNFTYTTAESGKQVSSAVEKGNTTQGQKITFDRSKYNTMSLRSAGEDGIHGNADDLITTYQFDNLGRTVTQQLKTFDENQSVAGVYNYSTSSEENKLKSNNKINSSASLGKNVINLVSNGNMERSGVWQSTYSGTTSPEIGTSETLSYMGEKSFLLKNTTITSDTGRAVAYQDISGLKSGGTYTLSAYVRTCELTETYSADDSGAYIYIRSQDSSGNYVYSYSPVIDEETDSSMNGGWRRLTTTMTLGSNVNSVRIFMVLRACTGQAYFDCVQFEEGSAANSYNLIENSSFEKASNDMPSNWNTKNISLTYSGTEVIEGSTVDYKQEGSRGVRIDGNTSKSKYYYQRVPVDEAELGETYIISGWSRAKGIAASDNHPDARWGLVAKIHYQDADGNTYQEYMNDANFNVGVSTWQYTSQAFVLKSKRNASDIPIYIDVLTAYYDQANDGMFDNIQLLKDVAQSYDYDSEGNLVSVSANAQQKENMEYEGNDLKTYTDIAGNKTTYNYNSKHYLTKATSPSGLITSYTYNGNGTSEHTIIKNDDDNLQICTGKSYTVADSANGIKAGAYLYADNDEHRNRTFYYYDMLSGLMTSSKTPNNKVTTYQYDDYYRLVGSVCGSSSVSYAYSEYTGRLKNIIFGDDTYSIGYDEFGNVDVTKVNDNILSENTYSANNGALNETQYGNGGIRQYEYDSFGNLDLIKDGSGNALYQWYYDSRMNASKHVDHVSDRVYSSTEDAIGRTSYISVSDQNSGAVLGEASYIYDERNNLTKLVTEFGGRTTTQRYIYSAITDDTPSADYAKDNLPTRYKVMSNRYVDYDYDSLNRLSSKTFSFTAPLVMNYTYHQSANRNESSSDNYTTTQLRIEAIDDKSYVYDYDEMGNITRIREGTAVSGVHQSGTSSTVKTYEYDTLNRLKRENNLDTNQTIVYNYDSWGNILSKSIYAYTTDTTISGEALSTVNYSYTAGTWAKMLTSYGNDTISYDSIGNPLSYRGATLSWDCRQLISYDNISYKYNSDGLRTEKTTATGTTTYEYVNGKLAYENREGNKLYYYYDSYGTPTGVYIDPVSGSTKYLYFTTNSMGDIIGVYDGAGTHYIEYKYDAWGNIVSETTPTGAALTGDSLMWSELIPFRYRGYYYDKDTGLYYLQSRYYDPEVGRFINADSLLDNRHISTLNVYAYCGNNPVNRVDPNGHAWYHWAIGAAIVAACAVATVITAGGFAGAVCAVATVANGVAAATTASTIAAGAFIGSSTALGMAAYAAVCTSTSPKEFASQGNWETVVTTAVGGFVGGFNAYSLTASEENIYKEPFLPDKYYSKKAPKFGTPYSSYENIRHNSFTGEYEFSTSYYDFAGRQCMRIDYTNHGYPDHGNPHIHFYLYDATYPDGIKGGRID